MSLYGMMRTSVSGMQAQSNRLSTVADNVANVDTTGYKKYSTEFAQLVRPGAAAGVDSSLGSGGVLTDARQHISQQGNVSYTQSSTDLAINGNGFFVVEDSGGSTSLTRAGSFVADADGFLVNAGGQRLKGVAADQQGNFPASIGAADSLESGSVDKQALAAVPTQNGRFVPNLPANSAAVTGDTPLANSAASTFAHKTSLTAYDNLGDAKLIDIYTTPTGPLTWEMTAFDASAASPTGGFPYSSAALGTSTLTFDPANGQLATGSPETLTFTVPNGRPVDLILTGTTQLAADYSIVTADLDGAPPASMEGIVVDGQGVLSARYSDGSLRDLYRIPLADVVSPDRMDSDTGTIFLANTESGDIRVDFAGTGSNGVLISGALEQSNVELADELTDMIRAQRGYTANSKVFQTGADLMDVIVNLRR